MKLGTYAIEKDYSHYIAKSSEIILAIVGTATKGPIGVPTICTSAVDFVNKFGNLNPNHLGTYAAQYFLAQSNRLYYVRVADSGAKKSTTKIAGNVADAIVLSAKTEGTYYNGYSVIISEATAAEGDVTFKMVIKNKAGMSVETHSGVKLSELHVGDTTVPVKDALDSQFIEVTSVAESVTSITNGTYTFAEGNDGTDSLNSTDYAAAADILANDNLNFNLFSIPGITDPDVIVKMLQMAEVRGDCFYLVDCPDNLTKEEVADWHNGTGEYEHVEFNSSYGALYWSWQRIYDPYNHIYLHVPPSVVVAPMMAKSARDYEIWYAPAGLQRGVISGVAEPVTTPTSGDVDYLYSDDNNVNCIINDPRAGLCVFGQKTLYRQDTALNRINVRMLLNYIKRVVSTACKFLTFEPNDRVTWNSFEDKVEPTLRDIQNHRGLYEYRIVKGENIVTDTDIDNYRMPCMVIIRPTKTAEEIPIYFTITSAGAEFNDVLESNGIIVEEY